MKKEKVGLNDHNRYYHLTDYHGYSYSISSDKLSTLNYGGLSLTTNPKINSIYGKSHTDFKFVLSSDFLKLYDANYYSDSYIEIGVNGQRKTKTFKEDEIRLQNKSIDHLSSYLQGTVLLSDLFSEKTIQWFLYSCLANNGSFFSGEALSEAPMAIESMYTQLYIWKKPIWIKEIGNLPSKEEMMFIKDCHNIAKSGKGFKEGIKKLAAKYPIIDHFGEMIDPVYAKRMFVSSKVVEVLNSYYAGRKYTKTSKEGILKTITRCIKLIGVGNNELGALLDRIERSSLLHPTTKAVQWGSILKDLIKFDIDGAFETIKYYEKENAKNVEWYDSDSSLRKYQTHCGTSFGRG